VLFPTTVIFNKWLGKRWDTLFFMFSFQNRKSRKLQIRVFTTLAFFIKSSFTTKSIKSLCLFYHHANFHVYSYNDSETTTMESCNLFITHQRLNNLNSMDQSPFEKLTVTHLVKKLPAFYGIWKFVTAFTPACHWSLSCARCTQSTPSYPISLTASCHSKFFMPIWTYSWTVVI
jgi:hypothetical protein